MLFAALYMSEGAPIGYIWWALPTSLRSAGVDVDRITQLTAALTLVWTLKFLWAPVVDAWRSPRWGRRHWIISAQLAMGVALLPLLFIDPDQIGLVAVALFTHALFASTQDAAVDSFCIATTADTERGGINGWMQVGMLLGRAIFGGAALVLESWIGRSNVILLLLGFIWSTTALVAFFVSEPAFAAVAERVQPRELAGRVIRAFSTRGALAALGFAILGGAVFEGIGAVAGPMLIDAGSTKEAVGTFFALPVIVATSIGALVGGWSVDRIGHVRGVMTAAGIVVGLALGLAVLLFSTSSLGARAPEIWSLYCGMTIFYLAIGALTASSYALFMDLSDPSIGATQFSAYMGATNLCETWATYAVGKLVVAFAYPGAFAVLAGVSAAAIPLLLLVRKSPRVSGVPGRTR